MQDHALVDRISDHFTNVGYEAPKYKFDYLIEFVLRDTSLFEHTGTADQMSNLFASKHVTRPSPVVQYQDANFYGYRTKVATRTDFTTVTVSFYDDRSHRALDIIKGYMEAISPITEETTNPDMLKDKQTIGPLDTGFEKGPIKELIVYHVFGGTPGKTKYRYLNPKITNITLDDLDMSESEVTNIAMTFTYDTYTIETFGAMIVTDADFDEMIEKGWEEVDQSPNPIIIDNIA